MTKNFGLDFIAEVSQDGGTVWVTAGDGSCIGRFSRKFGMDVHKTAEQQMKDGTQCLFCTHGPANESDWEVFISKMREYYGVELEKNLLRW